MKPKAKDKLHVESTKRFQIPVFPTGKNIDSMNQ